MKHYRHTQHPYSDEIRRRLFVSKRERRAAAAWEFVKALGAAVATLGLFAFIGCLLGWRG